MISRNNKKGEIDFEWLLSVSFVLIILVAVISSIFFGYNNFYSEINQKNIIASYNNVVTKLRQDSHQAVVAITASASLIMLDKNADQICKYELNDKNLIRYDKDNKTSIIFENIESLSFNTSENQPNLLTVRIYPADKKEMPFFTSFALRGLNNDLR